MYKYKKILLTGASGTVGSLIGDLEAEKQVLVRLIQATHSRGLCQCTNLLVNINRFVQK